MSQYNASDGTSVASEASWKWSKKGVFDYGYDNFAQKLGGGVESLLLPPPGPESDT